MRWNRPWLRYLAITAVYAAVYSLLRLVFYSHWQLATGFCLSCLLLVPQRYWPALFVGQAVGLGKLAYTCVDQFGLPWALTLPFASMILVMPAVFLFRKYRPVVDANGRVVISSLLLCILAVILLYTSAEALEYGLMQGLAPADRWSAAHVGHLCYLWFLGNSLGIYMIVPLVLWIYTEGDLHLRNIRTRIVRSNVMLANVAFLTPGLCLLAYLIEYSHIDSVRAIGQGIMLVTPVVFAVYYGWQGASLACMLANLAVVLSMPALKDPATLQTQELMMVSSTLWLMLGARFSVIRLRHSLQVAASE